MAKLYFNESEIAQNEGLNERLVALVEGGLARHEKQGSFRSLYEIEITGVAVYYRRTWRYGGQDEKE